jgi:hypothetical protein
MLEEHTASNFRLLKSITFSSFSLPTQPITLILSTSLLVGEDHLLLVPWLCLANFLLALFVS